MTITNMINKKGNTVPNQFIILDGKKTIFQSYNSKIAEWDGETLRVFPDWDYSKTTLKYFKQFINDFTSYTYTTKKEWEKIMQESKNIIFTITI